MNTLSFGVESPNKAILLKDYLIDKSNKMALMKSYLIPLSTSIGKPIATDTCFIPLYYPQTGNLKKASLVEASSEILEYCDTVGINELFVADSKYFEYLTGTKGLEKQIGGVFNCVHSGYEHIRVFPMLNYKMLEMSPEKSKSQDIAIKTIADVLNGTFSKKEEFKFKEYELITDHDKAKKMLNSIIDYKHIACDIETTGLPVGPTEILTIAFGDNERAFTIAVHNMYSEYGVDEIEMHKLLKSFFIEFNKRGGRLVFHNGLYDVKQLVYVLFMTGFNDLKGMLEGVRAIKFDDTLLLKYVQLNSTARISLGLKDLSYELLGDYAENVKDATQIQLEDLALYNAKDVAGTWYVFKQVQDELLSRPYTEILEPSLNPLLQMMLNGVPLDLSVVAEVRNKLSKELNEAYVILRADRFVKLAEKQLRINAADKYNVSHKVKQKTYGDFSELKFNPNSSTQLRLLLFDVLDFTPIEYTPKGEPKTNRASIEEFLLFATAEQKAVLDALIVISKLSIVITTFIGAFERLSITQDGMTTLHGNFNLGKVISGRLSSSEPNMQNAPSNSSTGKDIKSCFRAPDGWLYVGADFNALELRIGGILTKSEAIRKQILDGFDPHCMNASAMLQDELLDAGLDIDHDNVDSVNSIKELAPDIRQMAKPVGFLKQYGGGVGKLQQVLKCKKLRAAQISDAYDSLYWEVGKFAKAAIKEAMSTGEVKLAFGLTLKTPRLATAKHPEHLSEAQSSEARSAINAKTQSYGMLMNRAFIEFSQLVYDSEYRYDIKLISTIHDATYLLIKDDYAVVKWVNDNLIACMEWQDDPVLASDIKLGAELDVGYSGDKQKTLKNGATIEEVQQFLSDLTV
jgi:DNA polymerase-1